MTPKQNDQPPGLRRLEFPVYLQERVALLLLRGLHGSKNAIIPEEDKKLMDILADYYGKPRPFNVFDVKDFEYDILIVR